MKLSPAQTELLVAMSKGVRVLLITGRDARWFRTDNHRSVSQTVHALWKAKLVETDDKKAILTPLGADIAHANGGPEPVKGGA